MLTKYNSKIIYEKPTLVLILLIGFFLRIFNLDQRSIWLDEGVSIYISSFKTLRDVYDQLSNNGQSVLYHSVLHFWIMLFGESEFSVRFFSVLLAILTIYMVYKLGARLFNKSVGLLSSFLLAISTSHISITQEARPYVLVTLLFVLSVYFLIMLLEEPDVKSYSYYITSNVLLITCHLSTTFFVIAQNIYLLYLVFSKGKELKVTFKKWLLIQTIIVLAALPIFLIGPNKLDISRGILSWLSSPSLNTILDTFTKHFVSSIILAAVFLLLTIVGILFQTKENKMSLLLVLLFVPILLLFIFSKLSFPMYRQEYVLPLSVPFYIMVAFGLTKLNKYISYVTVIIIILFSYHPLEKYYKTFYPYSYKNTNWREAVKFIEDNAKSTDLIFFGKFYDKEPLFDYYSKRSDLIKKAYAADKEFLKGENYIKGEELEKLNKYKRIWLIGLHSEDRSVENYLKNRYNLQTFKQYNVPKIQLFERS